MADGAGRQRIAENLQDRSIDAFEIIQSSQIRCRIVLAGFPMQTVVFAVSL